MLFLDLKPDNVMITTIGRELRLVDLGGSFADSFRGTGQHTAAFAAPEQAEGGRPLDERTDIYLIGRVMQFVRLPRTYRGVTRRCLMPAPSGRYPSVASLQKAVAAARRRRSLVRMSPFAAAAACLAVALVLAFPAGDEGESPRPPVPPRANAGRPALVSERPAGAAAEARPAANAGTAAAKAALSPAAPANGKAESAEWRQMMAELRSGMDKAYNNSLADLANDSVIDSYTFVHRVERYSDEATLVLRSLQRKYPALGRAEIEKAFVDYKNSQFLPLAHKVE